MGIFKKKQDKEEKKGNIFARAKERHDRFQLILAIIGAIYFIFSTILSISKYSDSKFFPFIIISVVIYIVVFVFFLIAHRNDSKDIKNDTKTFKSYLKLFNIIENLFFVITSGLILLGSLEYLSEFNIFQYIITGITGLLLLIKLLSLLSKLRKWIKSRNKAKKKIQKEKEKEEKKKNK